MNTVTSLLTRVLSVVAIVAFHLLAALFVVLYVLVAGSVSLVRWLADAARRSGPRRVASPVRAS